ARSDSSRRRYPQPVAIEVLELTLSPGKPFFVDRDAELLGNGVNVLNVQVDERVRASITLVLRKVKANAPPRHRDEPPKAWFELMLPLLPKSEPRVPGDSPARVLDVKDRYDLLLHAATLQGGLGAMSSLQNPVVILPD